ncbi:MAG: hypothetical protein PHC75_06155 [Burkholderiales bacterium]|nr:hypothetical protein [Burkholderiales bacterium]
MVTNLQGDQNNPMSDLNEDNSNFIFFNDETYIWMEIRHAGVNYTLSFDFPTVNSFLFFKLLNHQNLELEEFYAYKRYILSYQVAAQIFQHLKTELWDISLVSIKNSKTGTIDIFEEFDFVLHKFNKDFTPALKVFCDSQANFELLKTSYIRYKFDNLEKISEVDKTNDDNLDKIPLDLDDVQVKLNLELGVLNLNAEEVADINVGDVVFIHKFFVNDTLSVSSEQKLVKCSNSNVFIDYDTGVVSKIS